MAKPPYRSSRTVRRSALTLAASLTIAGGAFAGGALSPALAYPSLEMLAGTPEQPLLASPPDQRAVSQISLLSVSQIGSPETESGTGFGTEFGTRFGVGLGAGPAIGLGAFNISASRLSLAYTDLKAAPLDSMSLAQTRATSMLSFAAFANQPAHRTIANDPFEKFNRFTFGLNDTSDKVFFKPLAKGYRKVTTGKMRKALRNFLNHIDSAGVFVNDILQGQIGRAAQTGGRFIINTGLGFGGMADPATRLGIPDHSEDFGQTLAVWGVPSGPYVVLPFFGPSTLRDSVGRAVDSIVLSPLNYIQTGAAQNARLSRTAATLISVREPLIEPLEEIERNSLDYYASFRSFYLQARRRDILNGQTVYEDLPNLDDFDDFEG